MKMRLGGVPMGVPTPPTLAEKAIPRSRGVARAGEGARSSTARATGSSISVVAVLEIHMDSTAAAAIKPSTRRRLLWDPKACTMVRATRRWAPEWAIAVDKIKPPRRSRMRGEP